MQVSHSRINCFEACRYQYKLRYLDRLKVLPSDDPADGRILGTALHTGLEKGVTEAIKEYYNSYTIITDRHIEEAMKLERLIPLAKKELPEGVYEVKLDDDDFVGYIDLVTPATLFKTEVEVPNQYDLYDFKYSNNKNSYMDSNQLHLYKYYFEKLNPGKRIRKLFYLFVPKIRIKQKKTETQFEFRKRIEVELEKSIVEKVEVTYDPDQVIDFLTKTKHVLEADEFDKNPNWLCNWCDYQKFCEEGIDYMILPTNERRDITAVTKKTIWIYGAPFSGKTTFANRFPDALMLNTDGNIKFVDAPYVAIKDEVTTSGRMTNRKFAWQNFKDAILELEKKDNDFETIVVDLLEDLYEYCRLYMYDQMDITHESDDSFRAWDKVTTEFLSVIKRLMALDYSNIILISHEDLSKDITKRGGDKITAIKPNLREKIANKIAGMVDIVARVIAENDEYTLSFKNSEVVFGGGRLKASEREIPLDYNAFIEVYEEANADAVKPPTERKTKAKSKPKPEPEESEELEFPKKEEPPKSRRRKVDPEPEAETVAEPPKRTRKRRSEAEQESEEIDQTPEETEVETEAAEVAEAEVAEPKRTRTRTRKVRE